MTSDHLKVRYVKDLPKLPFLSVLLCFLNTNLNILAGYSVIIQGKKILVLPLFFINENMVLGAFYAGRQVF